MKSLREIHKTKPPSVVTEGLLLVNGQNSLTLLSHCDFAKLPF